MHLSTVAPAPAPPAQPCTVAKARSDGPRLRALSSPAPQLLKDATVEPLSAVDTTKTLLATVLGRGDDAAFNARIIATTKRFNAVVHVAGAVLFISGIVLAFTPESMARTIATWVTVLLSAWLWLHVTASLSWDMMKLIVRTFEFWFLLVINTHNLWLWMTLFADERSIGFVALGANFALTFFTDANVYARRVIIRLAVLSSPGLLLIIFATALRLPPDIQFVQYRFAGLTVEAIDLLLNGNFTIAYFTAIRVYRSQHLIFSKEPILRIVCDMYFPSCRLVHQSASRYSSAIASAIIKDGFHLELIQNPSSRGIDAARCLVPGLTHWIQLRPLVTRLIAPLGALSIVLTAVGFAALTDEMGSSHALPTKDASQMVIEGLALAFSLLFLAISASHWQPILAKRICLEIDVWFVLFQLTLVSVGVCDALQWTIRPTMLATTAWLWCIWVLFLDAVPAPTRARLAFSKPFVVFVICCLVGFPMVLAYWLYFSSARELVRDRVLISIHFGGHELQLNLLGSVSSKVGTLWLWMCRFLWRELFRTRDAFKVIKRRVFYHVQS